MSPILHEQDDIVRDSIIKNKEKTKSYWEQLMLTAAAAAAADVSRRKPTPLSNTSSNRNSVCSMDSAGSDDLQTCMESELRNVKEEKRRIEQEIALRELRMRIEDQAELSMEEKIALELREMRLREEELKKLREQRIATSIEAPNVNGTCLDETSQDGSNCSEYGSDDKEPSFDSSARESFQRRAQSLESVSSGLSSGSGTTHGSDTVRDSALDVPRRRNVTVRPFDDPDTEDAPSFQRNEKETPIEREIRLAREREEELRRIQNVTPALQAPTKKLQLGRKDALENDTRGVQHRLATNRIQQEIEEASERELQLRTEGKILTTSIETVDGKVTRFTQLAEHAMLEGDRGGRKMRRSTSTTALMNIAVQEVATEDAGSTVRRTSLETRKFLSTNRGIMERFIATKGKVSGPKTPVAPLVTMAQPASLDLEPADVPDRRNQPPPSRKGFMSAEEKIQNELREMRKREEELRLQRAHAFAHSQPNLLNIGDEEEETTRNIDESENERHTSLPLYASNPNLSQSMPLKAHRKRFSLLEQWENRIQSLEM